MRQSTSSFRTKLKSRTRVVRSTKAVRLSGKLKRSFNPRMTKAITFVALAILVSITCYAAFSSDTSSLWLILENLVSISISDNIKKAQDNAANSSEKKDYPNPQGVATKNQCCAIIYLANLGRTQDLISSLNKLFEFSNNKYRHQVIVFFDDKNGKELFDTDVILSRVNISALDKTLIRFEKITFVFPEGFSEANKSQVTVWQNSFPGYNHMIAFWGYYIFLHPLVRNLEYFWRLDADTFILEPIKVDLFEVMRRKNYHYGFQEVLLDPDFVTMGLALFIQDYIRKNKANVTQPEKLSDALSATGERQPLPDYYNNFELVHVPTFQRDDMKAFSLAYLKTYRIYTHRWGDHVQRYAMVNMFLKPEEVYQFCECSYVHQTIQKKAVC